ncbi:MAG: hypothetical protein JJU36_11830 [Phycisphaeraceae bacterium]|nr:hypothetical protein [Phycisphaeraceae bacterium]
MNAHRIALSAAFLLAVMMSLGCSGAPRTPEATIDRFKQKDASLERFFDNSYGYAVFPEITKGAVGVGGAHGRGVVYEDGRIVGDVSVTQGTIGFQLGGQNFSQIIFFQTADSLERLKAGNLAFSANASAVAAASGAAATANYEDGVAVFSQTIGGLMYEASIGGQKFSFTPRE